MNKIILALLLGGLGAQLIKLLVILVRHKHLHWKDLIVTGGMPSSHSAFVVSLATIIGLIEGFSTSFAVSLVLACIVIRDAFGVRRTVGEEGMVINQMMRKLKMPQKTHFSLGHTPLQVLVGSLIGVAAAVGVWWLV